MRHSFLSTVAFSAPVEAGSDLLAPITAPVADTATAPAKPAKLRTVAKPRAAKPAKPVTAAPVEAPAPVEAEPAVRSLPIARTCATIANNATNFGGVLSDRDNAYITYYAGLAKAARGGVVTIRAIADHFTATDKRPAYNGSSKPHDAGVINRLRKAGILTVEADGTSFRFNAKAKTLAAYTAG